jgi:hypothetical protein
LEQQLVVVDEEPKLEKNTGLLIIYFAKRSVAKSIQRSAKVRERKFIMAK